MKLFLFFLIFFCSLSFSRLEASEPFEIGGKPYTNTGTHKVPLFMGREFIDLTSLSGDSVHLKTIQKDYERYHFIGSSLVNLSVLYVIFAGTGIIRPTLADSFQSWIPFLGLSGAGVTFGMLSKSKLREFGDSYAKNSEIRTTQQFQMNYSWSF